MKEVTKNKKSFLDGFVDFFYRWMPNSMVLVFLLTIIVAVLDVIFVGSPLIVSTETQISLLDAWTGGFWNLLTFSMQMALVMLTGYMLASAPVVKNGLNKLAALPKNAFQAMLLCGIVTFVLWWFHWGLGMMASIVLGRLCAAQGVKKGYKLDVPWLVAVLIAVECAGVGISQAGPLYGATPGYLRSLVDPAIAEQIPEVIPLTDTAVNGLIISQNVVLLIVILLICYLIRPKNENRINALSLEEAEDIVVVEEIAKTDHSSPAEWINSSPLVNMIIGIAGLIWSIRSIAQTGLANLSLNTFNFLMLMLCILLCRTPNELVKCCVKSVTNIWGVLLQFPFYAGIFGLISLTGLNTVIMQAFLSISNQNTFPIVAYIYSAILNMFVPSGGSKFIIEAPYIMQICTELNIPIARIIDVYNFADLNTNVIQPYTAIAFMAAFKVDFKQIAPYCAIVAAVVMVVNLLFIGFLY